MNKPLVLVVEDDRPVRNLIVTTLKSHDYRYLTAENGKTAIMEASSHNPDIVLLDIMLPGMDGWQICKEIRKASDTPIIMLTAKSEIFDKVLGLELGADDYIVKPFDTKEVLARIKAVARRSGKLPKPVEMQEVHYDKLSINLTRYVLKAGGKVIDAPPKEIELLFYLASNPNRVFTRDQLLDEIWGFDYYGDSRTIDVHIKRLRGKLCGISKQWELTTVWGVGYKFELNEIKES